MAPTTKNKKPPSRQTESMWKKYVTKNDLLYKIIFDPHYLTPVCCMLMAFETVLNVFIIENVKYTEIDWVAYMQEVEGFLNGTLDYKFLRGDTGPLVYPAGFVYVYTLFYYLTSSGKNIYLAQYIFLFVYILQTYLTYRIFRKTAKIPPYALLFSTLTSYRIHSLYVLRLFNDPIAVLFFYLSLNLFISRKWLMGSFFYSLGVSVKMNILLYAPCLLLAYLTNLSLVGTFLNLFICGIVQIILATPFLYGNPISYIKGSFDFGRIFEHKWTVNYRFLSKEFFENRYFHLGLLLLHLFLLFIFLPILKKYFNSYYKLKYVTDAYKAQINEEKIKKQKEDESLTSEQKKFIESFENSLKKSGKNTQDENEEKLNKTTIINQLFILPFFVTNLIGMACSRSLHYQFYSWYFHSLLYLVFCTPFSKPTMFLLLAVIESCWNIYPSTVLSSSLLHISHFVLLAGLYVYMKK